ncbi:hypothetical protein LguiA_025114 [Lonicera macranthoides]
MKKTIRCCISCILPCGALDVIRIVHANGRVDEISGTIRASEIMSAYPKHVLKKPSSPSDGGICPNIVIVPPEAELQRGKIYFLMPVLASSTTDKTRSRKKKKKKDQTQNKANNYNNNNICVTDFLVSDRYLSEILSEKVTTQRDRRRGRAGVWRPHLESICETPSEA